MKKEGQEHPAREHMTKKRVRTIALCTALAGTLSVGGILAYFTDADTATNEFTVGNIELDLQEPDWNPDTGKNMTPMETVNKNPQILNDGINDEFVFLEVVVPRLELVTANPDGTKNPAKPTELFTYTVNPGWTELTEEKKETENSVAHLYVWGTKEECTILEKGVTTGTLFDTVTMANVVEDQGLEETSPEIVINAYGIQTTDLDGGKTSAQEVWTILNAQMPTTDVEEQEDPNTDVKDSNRNSGNGAEENTGEEEQAETPGTEPDAAEKPGTEGTKPEPSKPEKQ